MEPDVHPEGWTEAFNVTTYKDAQALRDPSYKPRGARRHGPFKTYEDAMGYGKQIACSHFAIDKVVVAPNVNVGYLDISGNIQPA